MDFLGLVDLASQTTALDSRFHSYGNIEGSQEKEDKREINNDRNYSQKSSVQNGIYLQRLWSYLECSNKLNGKRCVFQEMPELWQGDNIENIALSFLRCGIISKAQKNTHLFGDCVNRIGGCSMVFVS